MMRLIDADRLRETLQRISYDDWNQSASTSWAEAYSEIADMINAIPTVEAEPVRHGKWMSSQGCAEVGECYCSKCGTVYYADDLYNVGETDENGVGQALMPNYCPNCGAKMDLNEVEK